MARTHQTCQQQSVPEIKVVRVQEVLLWQREGICWIHVPYSECWHLGQIILS